MPTETRRKGCETCRHMGTHVKCDGCLGDNGQPYDYAHWEEGNWLLDLERVQLAGERSIHCGGELDLWNHRPPQQVSKNWHRAAEMCGYVVGRLTYCGPNDGYVSIDARTHDGQAVVVWRLAEPQDGTNPIDLPAEVHRVYRTGYYHLAWSLEYPTVVADGEEAARELAKANEAYRKKLETPRDVPKWAKQLYPILTRGLRQR